MFLNVAEDPKALDPDPENFSTYSARTAAQGRSQPVPAGHDAQVGGIRPLPEIQGRPQVSGQMRTSAPGSATMLAVPAGVAQ